MAVHRDWRVLIRDNFSSGYVALATVEFAEAAGGPDVSSAGSPIFSAQLNGTTYAAANAFDGNASTVWLTGHTGTAYIGGSWAAAPVDVRAIRIRAHPSDPSTAPKWMLLQCSHDGAEWFTDTEYTNIPAWTAGELREFESTSPIAEPLAITSVTPDLIVTTGGTPGTVTVSGGTGTITGVTVGGAAATNVTDNGDNTASFTFPAHAIGEAADVEVTRGSETATLAGGVTYYEPGKSEVVGYTSLTDTTASPLRRGAYGTPRGAHASGAAVIDLSTATLLKIPENRVGSQMWVKLLSFNKDGRATQTLSDAVAYTFTTAETQPPCPESVGLTTTNVKPDSAAGQWRDAATEEVGAISGTSVAAPQYAVLSWSMEVPIP